jgi:hypothetical protein
VPRTRDKSWVTPARALALAIVAVGAVLTAASANVPTAGVLTGVVTLDGKGVEGATVTLTFMPGLDAPQGPVRQTPLASVETSGTGGFTLPLGVTDTIRNFAAQNSDRVNYLVQAFYRDVVQPVVSDPTLAAPRTSGTVYTAADFAYSTLLDSTIIGSLAVTPGEEVVGGTLSTPDVVTLELTAIGAIAGAESSVSSGSVDSGGECRSRYAPWVTIIAQENNLQPVGEVHANYDMTAKFDYGVHANTDLNGAFSFGGGPWKASVGTNHMGNKQTMTGATYGPFEGRVAKTVFRYRKERVEYTDDGGDGHVCRTDYRIVPEGWSGATWLDGDDVRSRDSFAKMDAARSKGWASAFKAKSYWTKKTSKGEKYTANVTAFGVSLSAQSMWSNQVDISFTFGPENIDHWLYGSNGEIADARTVYAW